MTVTLWRQIYIFCQASLRSLDKVEIKKYAPNTREKTKEALCWRKVLNLRPRSERNQVQCDQLRFVSRFLQKDRPFHGEK